MSVLALDIGTSSVRAVVHDERGRPIQKESAQTRYEPTHGHDGRADFDADHLLVASSVPSVPSITLLPAGISG